VNNRHQRGEQNTADVDQRCRDGKHRDCWNTPLKHLLDTGPLAGLYRFITKIELTRFAIGSIEGPFAVRTRRRLSLAEAQRFQAPGTAVGHGRSIR
jgi:hypothetical protein